MYSPRSHPHCRPYHGQMYKYSKYTEILVSNTYTTTTNITLSKLRLYFYSTRLNFDWCVSTLVFFSGLEAQSLQSFLLNYSLWIIAAWTWRVRAYSCSVPPLWLGPTVAACVCVCPGLEWTMCIHAHCSLVGKCVLRWLIGSVS